MEPASGITFTVSNLSFNLTHGLALISILASAVMDLAQGHVLALAALEKDSTFAPSSGAAVSAFGGSGGKYKAYNLGKGRGMSVLEMVAAMKKASGFEYKYEIIGRRLVP